MFNTFYNFLQGVYSFWFGELIEDSFLSFILKGLSMFLGISMLYYLLAVPLIFSFKSIIKKIYGGW